jgi:hypothetical protein
MGIYIKTTIYVRQIGDEFFLEKKPSEEICRQIQQSFIMFQYFLLNIESFMRLC